MYQFLSALSVLIICLLNGATSNEAPSCIMPCEVSTNSAFNRSSFFHIETHLVNSFLIISKLNGVNGELQVLVSANPKNEFYYSTTFYVRDWYFNVICQIFSQEPIVSFDEFDNSSIIVRFRTFRIIRTKLQQAINSNDLIVLDKLGTLQNGVKYFEEQLTKTQMQAKLKYAISNAIMSGSNWACQEPNPMKFPNLVKYCIVSHTNWVYFDLQENFTVNLIRFSVRDDTLIYTYNLAISPDNIHWRFLATTKIGDRTDYIDDFKLDLPVTVRYIKLKGRNNRDLNFRFSLLSLDWV